jgi:exosortase/archaeosortase family protein
MLTQGNACPKGTVLADVQVSKPDMTLQPLPAQTAASWDWNRVLTPAVVLQILPIVGLVLWTYWYPLLKWETVWRRQSAWSHGYLIPLIAVLLAHFRLKELNPRRIEPCVWGLALVLGGLLVRIWSQTLMYTFPGDLSFLPVVAGAALLVLGWEMFKVLWVPLAYLALMIPWDTKYYEGVALPLQTMSAAAAERFLGVLGYERIPPETAQEWLRSWDHHSLWVCRDGNALQLASGPLNVAEACSGLHLLFAFVALGVLMAFMYRTPLWERLLIMGSSVPIAIFCNFIRITLMALASDSLHFERLAAAAGAATWSASVPGFVLGMLAGDALPDKLASLRQNVLNPDSWLHQSFGFVMLGLAFLIMTIELKLVDMLFIEDEGPGGGSPKPDARGSPA